MKNLGIILLAVYLIAVGLLPLIGLSFPYSDTIVALLAIAAGAVLLWERFQVKLRGNWGMLLLGIWLILSGLVALLGLSFSFIGPVMALLAIAAGVLLLIRR